MSFVWIGTLVLMGCPKPIAVEPVQAVEAKTIQSNIPLDVLAGRISNAVFKDSRYDIEIPISDDWKAEIGDSNAALRLRLNHQSYPVNIEYWLFDSLYDSPIPSERCKWSFTDSGYYRKFALFDQTIVASCEYDNQSRLVFAIVIPDEDHTWQIEVHTEPAYLIRNLDLAYTQIQKVSLLEKGLSNASASEANPE